MQRDTNAETRERLNRLLIVVVGLGAAITILAVIGAVLSFKMWLGA